MILPSGTVTFLFTDIEGSTKLWEEHPEMMSVALARHDELMGDVTLRNDGHVFKTVGDAFCIAFANPENAGKAAQEAINGLAQCDFPLLVRMAIHTASIVPKGDDYFGPPLNRVARLLAIANGGQILVSEATKALLPGTAVLKDLGKHALKDLLEPMHVWQLGIGVFTSLRGLSAVPNNLHIQTTSFLGRDAEMAQISKHVENSRLVTLTGTGGTGKTRLSLQFAAENFDQFSDGVWICEFAALPDRNEVLRSVVTAVAAPETIGTLQDRLVTHLAGKKCLVILDNCEHVLETAADVADILTSFCPLTTVIATSREPLGLKGEVTIRVPSLPGPETTKPVSLAELESYGATALFLDRLKAVVQSTDFQEADAPVMARICQRLDGIPLAIELAAARGRAMSLSHIEKRLDDRFRLLTGGSRNALSRQQTLRALIDWSVQLLTEHERRFLIALSVFGGGWDLEAAEIVCGDAEIGIESFDVLDLLTALVDKSLVAYERTSDRYRLLESIRQYALEKLERDTAAILLRDQHADYFLTIADGLQEGRSVSEYTEAVRRFTADYENFRMAVEWMSGTEGGLEKAIFSLFNAYSGFWSLSRPQEFIRLMEPLLSQATDNINQELCAQARIWMSVAKLHAGDHEGLDEFLSNHASQIDIPPSVRVRWNQTFSYALFQAGRFEEALEHAQSALIRGNPSLSPLFPYLFVVKGLCLACLERFDEAIVANREALRELSAVGNERGYLACLSNNLIIHCLSLQHETAIVVALELNRRATVPRIFLGVRSTVLEAFGHSALERGDYELASVFLGGVTGMQERSGMAGDPLDLLGQSAIRDRVESMVALPDRNVWVNQGRALDWEPWFQALVTVSPGDCEDDVPFRNLIIT